MAKVRHIRSLAPESDQQIYWQAIVTDLDDAVIRYRPDLLCKWCNDTYARLLGCTQNEVIGRNLSEFLGPERTALALARVAAVLEQGSIRAVELNWRLPDGTTRWWSFNIQAVKSPVDGSTELQSVGRDIQALKDREAELQTAMCHLGAQAVDMTRLMHALNAAKTDAEFANAAKSRFLAGMSHELRTPLNAIIGFADIMRLGVFGSLGNPAYAEYIDDIWRSGRHLLGIISDLLDLSRVESGMRRMQPVEIDPAALAEDATSMMPPRDGSTVSVAVKGTESCGAFQADSLAIRQAVVNLLYNALKFTPETGKVWLAFHRRPGCVEIEVGDTGPGLTPQQIDLLLSPIGDINDDRLVARKGRGTGLGIPIARTLAEAHGGELRFESVPGAGTRAYLNLPQPPTC